MDDANDWDLQAVVRSCGASEAESPAREEARRGIPTVGRAPATEFLGRPQPVARPAAALRELDYLGLEHALPRAPFTITPSGEHASDLIHEAVLFSFPAASTSGQPLQPRKQPGRKPGLCTPRPKRSKKSQLKKVVCEVPAADGGVSTDHWAWRKYGQKPIKGSPYPRGYYKCSSLKSCMARKLVERSPAKPGMLVVTYIGEHCHAVPTMLSSLAGTTRHRPPASPDDRQSHGVSEDASGRREDSAEATSVTVDGGGGAETPDGEMNELWPVDMALDDFLGPVDDDFENFLHDDDDVGVLGRRLSL